MWQSRSSETCVARIFAWPYIRAYFDALDFHEVDYLWNAQMAIEVSLCDVDCQCATPTLEGQGRIESDFCGGCATRLVAPQRRHA